MRFLIFLILFGLTLGLIQLLLLRFLNKDWWQIKWVKRIVILLPVLMTFFLIVWSFGIRKEISFLANIGAPMAATCLVIITALILALPFSSLYKLIGRLFIKAGLSGSDKPLEQIDKNRRLLLKGTAAVFPLLTISAGAGGVAGSYGNTRIYMFPLYFKNLPSKLEGLRILHLTDSHLGIYKSLSDWESVIAESEKYKPDLIVLTGDVCDDLSLLSETLNLAASLKPEYGSYAVVGNHEYYRGIERVRRIYDSSPIPLLINDGLTLDIDGYPLFISGVDDPRLMNRDYTGFFQKNIPKSVEKAPEDSFKILMSHRPEGFNEALKSGIRLTLAGHTHGGQFGMGGRSIFANFSPESYLWGKYGDYEFQMYLSSGIGHWFPFRLGCPSEAPIIELRNHAGS